MASQMSESIHSMANTGEDNQSGKEWLDIARMILIRNINQLDVFVSHLGTPSFNAIAKWDQLNTNNPQIESRFYKFIELWHAESGHPNLYQIVSALKAIKRYDIVNIIEDDNNLKRQLEICEHNIADPDTSSSKPEWFMGIRLILIDHLKNPDVFFVHLGHQRLNLSTKWEQFSSLDVESRFFRVMDAWYEGNNDPRLTQIISALQDMQRNDIVRIIKDDVKLGEQLCNKKQRPIQASGDADKNASQPL